MKPQDIVNMANEFGDLGVQTHAWTGSIPHMLYVNVAQYGNKQMLHFEVNCREKSKAVTLKKMADAMLDAYNDHNQLIEIQQELCIHQH